MRQCETCAAYEPWDNGQGRCHLNPPIGVRDVRNEMWTPFPMVSPEWWCLQHHPKAKENQVTVPGFAPAAHQPPAPEDDF